MTLSELLNQHFSLTGVTPRQFAEKAGITPSYLDLIIAGHIDKPSADTLKRISGALDMDLDYLAEELYGILPPVKTKKMANAFSSYTDVPFFLPNPAAGNLDIFETSQNITLPSNWLPASKRCFAIQMQDDLLHYDGIRKGDYLIFERTPSLSNGEIGCFKCRGEILVRRYIQLNDYAILLDQEPGPRDPLFIDIREEPFAVLGRLHFVMGERRQTRPQYS